jgi:hypothetical protein
LPKCGLRSVNHKKPSVNCCSPKNKGILAKTSWEGLWTSLTVAIPIAEMTTPPAKLASAEKHIEFLFLLICMKALYSENPWQNKIG